MFQVLRQAFPIHLSTTVPTEPHFTDAKPMTYKGAMTRSVSHSKELQLEVAPEVTLLLIQCVLKKPRKVGQQLLEDVLF